MDNIPIEYRERMLAEQMAMMEALQFIVQILICFAILITFVILIVNLSGIVRTRLSDRRTSEHRQPPQPRRKAAQLCNPVWSKPKQKRAVASASGLASPRISIGDQDTAACRARGRRRAGRPT